MFHYSKYNPSVLFHPLAGTLHSLQLVNTALYLKSKGDFFPDIEEKLAVISCFQFVGKKKSIVKIVMNKWMIWNNYSELVLVSVCHNRI